MTDHPHLVRAARPTDAPYLVPLLAAVDCPAPADVIATRLQAMSRSSEIVLVAVRAERVLGIVTVHLTPVLHQPVPVGRLTLLVVAENAQRQGIGRALVEAAEREIAARGCAVVEVISNRRFVGAHAFYERLGYENTSYKFKKQLAPED